MTEKGILWILIKATRHTDPQRVFWHKDISDYILSHHLVYTDTICHISDVYITFNPLTSGVP